MLPRFFSIDEESQGGEDGFNYHLWEVVMFVVVGGLGGLIGAAFNQTNKWITIKRKALFGFHGTIGA